MPLGLQLTIVFLDNEKPQLSIACPPDFFYDDCRWIIHFITQERWWSPSTLTTFQLYWGGLRVGSLV